MTMRVIRDGGGSTWPDGGGFHLAAGLFFTRHPDGSVQIRRYLADGEGTHPDLDLTATPSAWASVVASMEAAGESHKTWEAAVARQTGATTEGVEPLP